MTDFPDSLAARLGALRLLSHVLRDGRMLGDGASGLTGPAAARALRLAGLTLRHMGRADAMLKSRMERQPATRVRDILRLALVEMFEAGEAPHGVVNDAVALARMSPRTAKQAGLVNAVLRGLTEAKAEWDALPAPALPPWLRKPVANAFGRDRLEAIEAAHLRGAPLDLTPKPGVTVEGAEVLPTGSLRLAGGQVSTLPGFDAGDWWVQDAAAAMPVRLLGDVAGLRVLDLCAAPGGKTMQLAAGGATVTALDLSEVRLRRVRANLERTGLIAEIVMADAFDWTPPEDATFDVVVLDAPCTATGTIRRHPDLPHLREARNVETLTKLQYRLLDRALTLVRPGGRVLYCTCSLLPVEGEHQVRAALKRHPGLTAPAPDPAAFGLPEAAASPHGLRLLPDLWPERGGMDGFYMSVLHRPGAETPA